MQLWKLARDALRKSITTAKKVVKEEQKSEQQP